MDLNIAEIRQRAEEGSLANQCVLGISYLYGYDVEPDYNEAFRWLSVAADRGASCAVLNLGLMYAKGLGTPQDVPEGIRLLTAVAKPSDNSDAYAARIELGRIYSLGLGIPVNVHEALRWYSAAIALVTDQVIPSQELREAMAYVASANG